MLLIALALSGPISSFWLGRVDERFAWMGFLIFGVFAFLNTRLKCPKCRKPVGKKQVKLLGVSFTAWGGTRKGGLFFPRTCTNCGTDLTVSGPTSSKHLRAKEPAFRFADEGWRAASPRKKRIALGFCMGANLLGIVFSYFFRYNEYLIVMGLLGAAIFAGILLTIRDK